VLHVYIEDIRTKLQKTDSSHLIHKIFTVYAVFNSSSLSVRTHYNFCKVLSFNKMLERPHL